LVGFVLLVGCGSASTESKESGNKVPPVAATNQPSETNSAKPGEKTKNLSRVFQTADLEVLKITLKGKPFELWIMDTSDKCREGMMFLEDKEVRDDQGMIFAFKEVQKAGPDRGFWMHNTILPLDILYVSKDKRVVDIATGVPFSDKNLPSKADFQYVIELKGGTAQSIGLKVADQLSFNVQGKE